MTYPTHPSQSANDLMFSVLYDDFTAEQAIKAIKALDYVVPFDPPPFVAFQVRVAYATTEGGSLSGATSEWVWWGEKPTKVPTPRNTNRYEFRHWETETGLIVDPSQVIVTEDTKFTAVFEYIAPQSYTVSYVAGPNGTLTGQAVESVIEGKKPSKVPTPKPDADYKFTRWVDESGKAVDPAGETITQNRTFTAEFEYVLKQFNISAWDVMPRTTATSQNGRTENKHVLTEGEAISLDMFTKTSDGPTFNAKGEYMQTFDEVPTGDTWYQRIDNTESLNVNNYHYRKTFYAGRGGSLNRNGSTVYAYTSEAISWSGTTITAPTPVADDGWHFDRWVNLATG